MRFPHITPVRMYLSAIIIALLIGFGLGALVFRKTLIVKQGTADNPAAVSSVNLMIDYGNGIVRNWNTVSWHEAMSVMDLVDLVASTGAIKLEKETVEGSKYRVGSIDDMKNDSSVGRRWQYWVNNTYEPRVASKYYLKPGDLVILIYAKE